MQEVPGRRWILAGTICLVGCLQAWDSDVLQSSPVSWILVASGILVLAAAALVTGTRAGILVAVPVSALLLLGADWLSEIPLEGVLVITLAGGALLGGNEYLEAREAREAEEARQARSG